MEQELQRLKEEKQEDMKMQSRIFNSSGGFNDNRNEEDNTNE